MWKIEAICGVKKTLQRQATPANAGWTVSATARGGKLTKPRFAKLPAAVRTQSGRQLQVTRSRSHVETRSITVTTTITMIITAAVCA